MTHIRETRTDALGKKKPGAWAGLGWRVVALLLSKRIDGSQSVGKFPRLFD
jgi:hypothetical protein